MADTIIGVVNGFARAMVLCLVCGCGASRPVAGERTPEARPADRPVYARTLVVPAECDQRLELERLGCAIEHAIERPDFPAPRRACALRHMRPIRQNLQSYVQSLVKLEDIDAKRSPSPGDVTAAGPPGLRLPGGDEVSAQGSSAARLSDRELRAEREREDAEGVLDERSARAVTKLAELFRYLEPCLQARIPFEVAAPAADVTK